MKKQRGQIALVVLLIMIVLLTLGISVAQRGLTDVSLSTQEEETSRAFQAAEAGVEQSLRTLAGTSGATGAGINYAATVSDKGGSGFVFPGVLTGESLTVDLTAASASLNALEVYFIDNASEGCGVNPAALEAAVVTGNNKVRRSVFDVDAARTAGNNFTLVGKGSFGFEGTTFCARARVNIPGNAKEVRLRPVYAAASLGVGPFPAGADLGGQIKLIRSEGSTGSGITRAVEVERSNPQAPSIFDYVLFSGGELVK